MTEGLSRFLQYGMWIFGPGRFGCSEFETAPRDASENFGK
jgi:hypothetical protein